MSMDLEGSCLVLLPAEALGVVRRFWVDKHRLHPIKLGPIFPSSAYIA